MNFSRDDILVSVEGVSQSYGAREVLHNVTFQVRDLHATGHVAGQVIAILGQSGIGKTQLMRIMAGLQHPSAGAVMFGPNRVAVTRGRCGFVFQNFPLLQHRTLTGNLAVAGIQAGMSTGAAHEKALGYIDYFHLGGHATKYPAELSGGMKQRAAVAQQLMSMDGSGHIIRTMMLDEPFSALDYHSTRAMCKLLREVADMDETNVLFVTTHDIRAALCLADYVLVMKRAPSGGGYVAHEFDLVARDLTWHPDVDQMPEFAEVERELIAVL